MKLGNRNCAVIGEFHHVVEIPVAAADLQHVHQALVRAGDRLELLDAIELALEGMVAPEGFSMNNLHGAQRADGVARQPDLAVAAVADLLQQLVVGHGGRFRVQA